MKSHLEELKSPNLMSQRAVQSKIKSTRKALDVHNAQAPGLLQRKSHMAQSTALAKRLDSYREERKQLTIDAHKDDSNFKKAAKVYAEKQHPVAVATIKKYKQSKQLSVRNSHEKSENKKTNENDQTNKIALSRYSTHKVGNSGQNDRC